MIFDDKGLLIDVEMKINPVGKCLTITDEKINNRKNIILLGDIVPDVNMIQKCNYNKEATICIGFLNYPIDFKK